MSRHTADLAAADKWLRDIRTTHVPEWGTSCPAVAAGVPDLPAWVSEPTVAIGQTVRLSAATEVLAPVGADTAAAVRTFPAPAAVSAAVQHVRVIDRYRHKGKHRRTNPRYRPANYIEDTQIMKVII